MLISCAFIWISIFNSALAANAGNLIQQNSAQSGHLRRMKNIARKSVQRINFWVFGAKSTVQD